MAIPVNKKELKKAILLNYEKLRFEFTLIPLNVVRQKEMEGHAKNTRMSVSDLVSYLIGWGELVLKWNKKKERGEQVNFPETGFKWSELGELAGKFYRDFEKDSYNELLNKFDKVVSDILVLVESKSNKELYGRPWYEKYTLGRMIQLNTSSPYQNAKGRIRKWKKEKGIK